MLPSAQVSFCESAREIFSRIAPSRTLFQRGGALVICGTVSTFYQKQLAQEVIRSVCDDIEDMEIINTIRVR